MLTFYIQKTQDLTHVGVVGKKVAVPPGHVLGHRACCSLCSQAQCSPLKFIFRIAVQFLSGPFPCLFFIVWTSLVPGNLCHICIPRTFFLSCPPHPLFSWQLAILPCSCPFSCYITFCVFLHLPNNTKYPLRAEYLVLLTSVFPLLPSTEQVD